MRENLKLNNNSSSRVFFAQRSIGQKLCILENVYSPKHGYNGN